MKESKQWGPVRVGGLGGDYFRFKNLGDTLEGRLEAVEVRDTSFGPAKFAYLIGENGTRMAVVVTAGLEGLEGLTGRYIKIVYTGEKLNERTRRRFKAFDVFALKKEGMEEEVPF